MWALIWRRTLELRPIPRQPTIIVKSEYITLWAHITLQTYVNGLIVNLCIADIMSIASLIVLTVTKIFRQHVLELIADRMYKCFRTWLASVQMQMAAKTLAESTSNSMHLFLVLLFLSFLKSNITSISNMQIYQQQLLQSWMPTMFENTCTTVSSRIGQFILKACLLYFPCLVVTFVCYCKIYRLPWHLR
jgi:hypothetical protein